MPMLYSLGETIHEGRFSLVRRGTRLADGLPVIVKQLKPGTAGEAGEHRLRQEYDRLARIDLPGVIKVLDLIDDESGPALVEEDIGGEDLDHLLARENLPLPRFLKLAAGLAETLAALHRQGIIHKDINPHHIIYNQGTCLFRLIGFGLADDLPQSHVALQPPAALERDLRYISPEATGRMNRPVDYRTDFYSLGAVFYRIVTGCPPFQAKDSLGLVHCHIASLPPPPRSIAPEIPEIVSCIVMKLLSKAPEDRYRSGLGLLADLNRCTGGETDFEPGGEDFPDRLQIPRTLYGREAEIARLLAAFDRACNGGRELLLIAGYAGVGKTALVHEMDRALAEKHCHFIEGKFEQLQRSVPYFAWLQAFAGFVNYLLMESTEALGRWQEIIRDAVDGLGKVLTEVIPNLEFVIGAQPEVPALGGAEARNRFEYVFLRLVRALAAADHPLVVFLDDLQWIDAASLNLLQGLLNSADVANILVVGAFRDNEVDAAHPLAAWIEAMRAKQRDVELLPITDLGEESVNTLIADTLHDTSELTRPLSRLIYSKTGGNPFFLRQTLMALAERRAIAFDNQRKGWQWDMEAITALGITDNVVVLMLEKLQALPLETRNLIPLAACMGFRFDPAGLGIIADQPKERIQERLRPALHQGLLLPIEGDFRFAHDRVQQAAYSLLPNNERRPVHWRIGRRLLRESAPAERSGLLFDIVNQLNLGASCLSNPGEARELADLNRQAGVKAKAGAAFLAALEYFEAGLALLGGEEGWGTDYELSLLLHQEAAEASCLCGRYERMTVLVSLVKERARTVLEAVPAYRTEIRGLTAQGRLVSAIQSGLHALELLGLSLPEEPSADEVRAAMARAFDLLQQRTVAGLADLPAMTAPEQLARLSLLSEIGEPAYAASPHFFLIWASAMAEISLRHGNSPLSPFAYAAFALALCATGDQIKTGSLLSKAAIALIDSLNARSLRCRLLNIHGCTIQPWTEPLRDTLSTLSEAVEAGAESGDFTSASYAAFNSCTAAFFMGEPLEELDQRISANLQIIAGLRQTYIWNWVAFHVPLVRRLHGEENLDASVDDFDERAWLSAAREANDCCGLAYYFLGKLIALYLLGGGPDEVDSSVAAVKKSIAGFQGAFAVPVFSFYLSLTLLKQHALHTTEDVATRTEVRNHLGRLEDLAVHAPMNFGHKRDLIAAELTRLEGDAWRAAGLYDKAIAGARDNGFLQEEALAHELAAKFYLSHGREDSARFHFGMAHQGYNHWQAFAKVEALEAEHPQWMQQMDKGRSIPKPSPLDLESVLKATRTISSVIEMDLLLAEVLRIVIENAGAQTGFLLREGNGGWIIAAKGEFGGSAALTPAAKEIDDGSGISEGVVNFVARTRKAVLLADAATQGDFVDDPQIRRGKTRSLLALPITHRGRLVGILYLVNNLATHVFTKERLQLIEILAAQAAISLETASAYEGLRLNELRYRLGQSAANIGTWEYDLASERFWGSDVAKRIFGLKPEDADFSTEKVESCIPDRQRVHQALLDLINTGVPYDLEFEVRPECGSAARGISSRAELYRNQAGVPVKVIGVIQDITERKKAEAEIRRLNDQLEQRIKDRTVELQKANEELQKFNDVFVGRELKMVELKKKIKELEAKVNEAPCGD